MVEMGVPEPEEAEESVQVEVSGADRIAEPEQQMGNHSEQEEADADEAVRQKEAVWQRKLFGKGSCSAKEAVRQRKLFGGFLELH
ncbi:hypothetical protein SASPL_121738 [Salvia splendens]|uniref:Uncharacterized protein n=1 Tax=Salvia splendens TaxID=180675 RepID=A0A8X8ZWU6_SALSN|nr:hypothetical protein SASPL_121738 [Salvia splendens]